MPRDMLPDLRIKKLQALTGRRRQVAASDACVLGGAAAYLGGDRNG